MAFRPYQVETIETSDRLESSGVRRILMVLPTGAGKTVVMAEKIRRWIAAGLRVVFLAHRRELIRQAFCKLVRYGIPPHEVGIVMAGTSGRVQDGAAPPIASVSDRELFKLYARRRPGARVFVASIDSFRNAAHPHADVVVFDEAHRALAKSYADVQHDYPKALVFGATATPFRADGKPLSEAFDEMIVGVTYEELVECGYLVKPRVFSAPENLDLSGVKKSGNDYDQKQLAEVVNKTELVGNIVEHWLERGNDAPTFVFAVNVAHSKSIAERFNAAGIKAEHVDASTDPDVRETALARLESGDVRVVCNCNVFTEGTDVTCVKTIVLARPTHSEGMMMQQAGRGSRPDKNGLPFVILDHANVFERFKLPHSPREFSLDAPPKARAKKAPPAKRCPSCLELVASHEPVCPSCSYAWPAAEMASMLAIIEEDASKLVEISEDKVKEKPLTPKQLARLDSWNGLIDEWHEMNRGLDKDEAPLRDHRWLIGEWRRRTGQHWPPKGSKIPRLTPEQIERSALRHRKGLAQPTLFDVQVTHDDPYAREERFEVTL